MSNLTKFLLARVAEDEAVARAATRGPWAAYVGSVDGYGKQPVVQAGFDSAGSLDDSASPENAAHIARHDPARVLAECEAKRRIVDLRERAARAAADPPQGAEMLTVSRVAALNEVLRILVQPYADHPDLDPAWRLE